MKMVQLQQRKNKQTKSLEGIVKILAKIVTNDWKILQPIDKLFNQ